MVKIKVSVCALYVHVLLLFGKAAAQTWMKCGIMVETAGRLE